MPRALVTGGTGFIGSNLALELERQGWEVLVADHRLSAAKNIEGLKGRVLELDVTRPFVVDGPLDVIFHQAAITDPRHADDAETYDSNVNGFRNILELAERTGAKIVYASTAGLYGNGPVPMREGQPKELLTAYARSKLRMDEMALALVDTRHIVGLRYFNVFGPREAHKGRPSSMIYHLARQMSEKKRPRIFKWGEQRRDHIYVKDVVTANLLAVNGTPGVYNVGTGIGTSFNELVAALNEVLGTNLEAEFFDMPYDPKTYQHHTVAETTHAYEGLGFRAAWSLRDALTDYLLGETSPLDRLPGKVARLPTRP